LTAAEANPLKNPLPECEMAGGKVLRDSVEELVNPEEIFE
jgi:hypothetical protein